MSDNNSIQITGKNLAVLIGALAVVLYVAAQWNSPAIKQMAKTKSDSEVSQLISMSAIQTEMASLKEKQDANHQKVMIEIASLKKQTEDRFTLADYLREKEIMRKEHENEMLQLRAEFDIKHRQLLESQNEKFTQILEFLKK